MELKDPRKLPEVMLRMILQEMIKEGITEDDCQSIYESSSDLDEISSVLKKFGITDIDYDDYGFFAKLLIENINNLKNDTPLIRPKLNVYKVHFKTIVRKFVNEYWELEVDSYDRSYITDMVYNGDFSYYDGEMVDDDVTDSETDDWEITDIVLTEKKSTRLKESVNSKNILLENRDERQKELRELNKLKMIIERRIQLLTP